MKSLKPTTAVVSKVLVVVFLTLVSVQGQSNNGPSDSDCEDAWTSSSASSTCGADTSNVYAGDLVASVDTSRYTAIAQNNKCYVEVNCLRYTNSIATRHQTYTGTTSQVKDLHNCDGYLKSSC